MVAPKLAPWIVHLWAPFRRKILRKVQRIVDIEVRGLEHLRSVLGGDCGVLITPNHSSHTDPLVLLEVARRLNIIYIHGAWQVFAKAHCFAGRNCAGTGVSVWTGGGAYAGIPAGRGDSAERTAPAGHFCRREVYHLNDRVTPFQEGPAAIALTAGKRSERPVWCVPCAMKFTYVEDPMPELLDLMDRLNGNPLRPRPICRWLTGFTVCRGDSRR